MIFGKSNYFQKPSAVDLLKRKTPIAFCTDQRGALLVSLILTLTIIAILGAVMVQMTTTSTLGELLANRQQRAYYLAESGGRHAIPQIQADPAQAEIDLHGKTFTLANADQFTLTIDNSTSGITILDSEGIVQPGDWLESRVKLTYEILGTYVFEYGAFSGTDKVVLEDRAYIDSYDSSVGPWSVATRNQNGHIGTNRIGDKAIEVKNNAIVYGDANVGVGGDPVADIKVDAGAQITGNRSALGTARNMTPRGMPTGGGAPIDFKLEHFDTYTYTGGEYRLNKLEMKDDAILTISGHVTLYVEDFIKIGKNASLNILPGSSLTIYADKELEVKEDARVNENGIPEQLIIYGTVNFDPVKIIDRVIMKAAIYAPEAKAQVTKTTQYYGSIIAKKVEIKDDAKFHYDEALGRSGGVGARTIQYF